MSKTTIKKVKLGVGASFWLVVIAMMFVAHTWQLVLFGMCVYGILACVYLLCAWALSDAKEIKEAVTMFLLVAFGWVVFTVYAFLTSKLMTTVFTTSAIAGIFFLLFALSFWCSKRIVVHGDAKKVDA